MKPHEILEDICRVRAEPARESNYDVKTMSPRMKEHLKELEAQGWRVASPEPREKGTAYSLREEPSKQKPEP